MFNNYLKIAVRNIKKYKAYSFINIFGLTIGMASCIFIFIWVQDELSFDRFHANGDYIYRVINEITSSGKIVREAGTPAPLGPALKEEFPEIVNYTRFFHVDKQIIKSNGKSFKEDAFIFADQSIFELFSFSLIKGDRNHALSDPLSVVITEEVSKKYFNEASPIGKVLDCGRWGELTVTGVIRIPANSHLQFDFLAPFDCVGRSGFPLNIWTWTGYYTYVQLKDNSSYLDINGKIADVLKKHDEMSHSELSLQSLTQIHLHSSGLEYDHLNDSRGDIKTIRIFTLMALFILVIACINFMNLTTARSANRSQEVGLRKVVGANRTTLIRQFFGESLFLSFIAMLLALSAVMLLLPVFNVFSGKATAIQFIGDFKILMSLIGITVFTGLLSGCYPAIFLSSFQPAHIFKGKISSGSRSSMFRRVAVLFQFSITILLIICTLVASRQLNYMRNRDLGYNSEHILSMNPPRNFRQFDIFKNLLKQNANILNVTGAMPSPASIGMWATDDIVWDGKGPDVKVSVDPVFIGYDFFETFGMEIVEGRSFSKQFSTDESESYILNQEAVKVMGFNSPIGKPISLEGSEGSIVGVVKNFHHNSLHNRIDPLVLRLAPSESETIFIKVRSEDLSNTINFMKNVWKEVERDYPFEIRFYDETIDGLYRSEIQLGRLFNVFTVLAIFISCLGLLGLSSFMAERRTKEIGIRKVLGASVSSLVKLLSREFIVLVGLANIIAWPVAYFTLNQWLQQFAYRIGWGMNVFLLSGLLALLIAMFTVSYQAVKAATANPVDSLRNE